MPYIIDGHNLIPKVPGISLQDIDDEEKLINLLQDFARINQTSIEVYFDKAPAGFASSKQLGRVKAIFVSDKTIADERIIKRIQTMGKNAKNWTVVTSDRMIITNARASHAKLLTSDEFSKKLVREVDSKGCTQMKDTEMSEVELAEWLKLFG
jgi:hypothetical protein